MLGDRARPSGAFAGSGGVEHGTKQPRIVEALVLIEVSVFGGEDREHQHPRNLVHRDHGTSLGKHLA